MKHLSPLLACLLLFFGQALQVHSSDNFAGATDLATFTLPTFGYIASGGTAEVGEPAHAGSPAANSHWFRWKAPSSSPCIFRELINADNARIAVYTGNKLTSLTLVTQGRKRVFFSAIEGVTYHIALDSPGDDVYEFKPYPVGGGDEIATATPITGTLPLLVIGNNALATASPTDDEWHPDYDHKSTVWWRWTSPSDGAIRQDARYCDFFALLTAYERAPGGSLVRLHVGTDATGMKVKAGHDYFFRVDAADDPGQIGFWLEWIPTTPPPNDNIANAIDLGSAHVVCDGQWMLFATAEANLVNEDIGFPQWGIPGEQTAWWKWTCPQTGLYRFSRLGADGHATIRVYSGTPPLLGSIGNSEFPEGVHIVANAGTTYWIQIKSSWDRMVRAELNIHPAATEPRYFAHFWGRRIFRLYGAQRHPDADPDGDGFSNEIEFACGSNPEINNPDDPNLPRLLPHTKGRWKLQWGQDSYYVTGSPGQSITLAGKLSLDLASPWTDGDILIEAGTNRRYVIIPSAAKAFGRLELTNPSWNLNP